MTTLTKNDFTLSSERKLNLNNESRKIVVFTTSKERNGTALLRDNLARMLPDRFIGIASYHSLILYLIRNRNNVSAVFALSDPHYLYATAVIQLLKIKIPILLGVYHPRQWEGTLDSIYSSRFTKVFRRVLECIPLKNIVFSSIAGFMACKRICPRIEGIPNIVAGPVDFPLGLRTNRGSSQLNNDTFSVCTVGRFVDFKVSSVFAMINVVEELIGGGRNVSYHIYGEGPREPEIRDRIRKSKFSKHFYLHGYVSQKDFSSVVSQYHLFWGMGGALVQVASLAIPCLVAIQGEERGVTYGLFSDFDHSIDPMFGDPTEWHKVKDLTQNLLALIDLSGDSLEDVGSACAAAAVPYGREHTLTRLMEVIDHADSSLNCRISVLDLLLIRAQTWYSRITGVRRIHT